MITDLLNSPTDGHKVSGSNNYRPNNSQSKNTLYTPPALKSNQSAVFNPITASAKFQSAASTKGVAQDRLY